MPTVSIQVEDTAVDSIQDVEIGKLTTAQFWLSIYLLSAPNHSPQSFHYSIEISSSSGIKLTPKNVYEGSAPGVLEISTRSGELLPPIKLDFTRPQYQAEEGGILKVQSPIIRADLSTLFSALRIELPQRTKYFIAFPISHDLPLCSAGALLNDTDPAVKSSSSSSTQKTAVTVFDPVFDTDFLTGPDLPDALYRALRNKASDNTFVSISPESELYASGDERGKLIVSTIPSLTVTSPFDSNTPELPEISHSSLEKAYSISRTAAMRQPRRILTPHHLLDITSTVFFPTGTALLSAGRDMQIKVWNLQDGSNPRTFRGHKKAISDLALVLDYSGEKKGVGSGRNFVSAGGDDSSVKLWETGSGQLVHNFEIRDTRGNDTTVSFVCVLPTAQLDSEFEQKYNAVSTDRGLDFETKGNAILVVHQNLSSTPENSGTHLSAYDLYTRAPIFQNLAVGGSHVTSFHIVRNYQTHESLALAGTFDGKVVGWTVSQIVEAAAANAKIQETVPLAQIAASITSPITTISVSENFDVAVGSAVSTLCLPLSALKKNNVWIDEDEKVSFLVGFDSAEPSSSTYLNSAENSLLLTGKGGLLYQYRV